jgi:hypothetical protein
MAWLCVTLRKNVPSDALILEDLAAFLQLEPKTSKYLEVDQLVTLDGWADGLELNVKFTFRPQKLLEPLNGPLTGLKFNDGYTYGDGQVDFSYSKYGQKQWKLIAAKLKKVPAITNKS